MIFSVCGRLSTASWTFEQTRLSSASLVGSANTEHATPFLINHGWKLAKVELYASRQPCPVFSSFSISPSFRRNSRIKSESRESDTVRQRHLTVLIVIDLWEQCPPYGDNQVSAVRYTWLVVVIGRSSDKGILPNNEMIWHLPIPRCNRSRVLLPDTYPFFSSN